MTTSTIVLDASAVLAFLNKEPGYPVVSDYLAAGCAMSAVNLAEVAYKLAAIGVPPKQVQTFLDLMGIEVCALTAEHAIQIAQMKPAAKAYGLSLADLACLALGKQLLLPVLTADRVWEQTDYGIEIVLIR